MALSGAIVITITKLFDPQKKAYFEFADGKDITIVTANLKHILPIGASDEDSLYVMVDGTMYWGVESFDDTTSELSATDRTGS